MKTICTLTSAILIITSCTQIIHNSHYDEIELSLLNEIIERETAIDSTEYILETRQSFFAFDSLNADTGLILYNAFVIGEDPHYQACNTFSLEHIKCIIQRSENDHIIDEPMKLQYTEIGSLPIIGVDIFKEALIPAKDSFIFTLQWPERIETRIDRFYTISEMFYDSTMDFGMIGLNKYRNNYLESIVYFFSHKNNPRYYIAWNGKFQIVNYRCHFINDELVSIDPNAMISLNKMPLHAVDKN